MDDFEGSNGDPFSLHKYLYCKSNPIDLIDINGHEGDSITMQFVTAISMAMNAYSAVENIRAKRYALAVVDILSLGLGAGGIIGPGTFGKLATAEGIIASAAQLRAGINGAQQVCQAWALVDILLMAQANAGNSSGDTPVNSSSLKPTVPNNIPATMEDSVVDKLQRYLLNFNHEFGGPKAKFFKEALGFDLSNMSRLSKQITFVEKTARATQMTEYGQKYEQTIKIAGANGRNIDVLFVWIKNNDGVVRLVTAIPNTL